METKITNKKYIKPREIFDDACILIANQLEKYDFKYSKSQATIKKKEKLLTYVISFFSSHYNYISEDKGHVVMEFICTIEHKKDIIYRISQKELRSEIHRFEIFDNETKGIAIQQIETAIEFIKANFLPVVTAIEADVNIFFEEMVKRPIARYDDYGYSYEKKFFEIFNREDLIEKYTAKKEEFAKSRPAYNRATFNKYIKRKLEKADLSEFDPIELQKSLPQFWLSANVEKEYLKPSYVIAKEQYEELLKENIADKTDWLTEYYTLVVRSSDYIKEEKLKEEAFAIIGRIIKHFKDE